MPAFTFPVAKGKRVVFPAGNICPWCKKRRLGVRPGMAILNAGAMRAEGKDRYGMATDDAAFFTLIWHTDHSNPDEYDFALVDIADLVDSGQFELHFCSTDCLRGFMNFCVDELERRRKLSKRKIKPGGKLRRKA